jgi:hypothetical protein
MGRFVELLGEMLVSFDGYLALEVLLLDVRNEHEPASDRAPPQLRCKRLCHP